MSTFQLSYRASLTGSAHGVLLPCAARGSILACLALFMDPSGDRWRRYARTDGPGFVPPRIIQGSGQGRCCVVLADISLLQRRRGGWYSLVRAVHFSRVLARRRVLLAHNTWLLHVTLGWPCFSSVSEQRPQFLSSSLTRNPVSRCPLHRGPQEYKSVPV